MQRTILQRYAIRLLACERLVVLLLPAWVLLCSFAPAQDTGDALPWRTIPLQVVLVSDNDGTRQAATTPQQMQTWVDFTNKVFASAHVRFSYRGDAKDTVSVHSTLLNRVMESSEATFTAAVSAGNRVAARYPGRLLVLVRWGPADQPSANGFSHWDYNFLVMSPFAAMNHCGHPHTDALAHEIGHYLGLPHTFAGEPFPTREDAAEYFNKKGRDPAVFDGDGFADTPPDPAIRTLECVRTDQVELDGVVFPLPRRNIMSYYDERDSLSRQQIARVRWILDRRLQGGMAMPSNSGAQAPLEAEELPVVEARAASTSVQTMAGFGLFGWSGNKHLFCSGNPGSAVTLQFKAPRSGRYAINLYLTLAPDFGIVQCSLDGRNLGAPIDLYAPIVMPSGRIATPERPLAAGTHTLTFSVVGKNPLSSRYNWGIDCLELRAPQENNRPQQ